jgi:hypothetical protein
VIVEDDDSIPAPCRPEAVAVSLWKLFDAVNRSDLSGVDTVVGDESEFQWYSVSEGNPSKGGSYFTARNLEDMKTYLAERSDENEKLDLLALQVRYDSKRHEVSLQLEVRRTADDLDERGFTDAIAHGKGAVECDGGKLVLMSLGLDKDPAYTQAKLCSSPSDAPLDATLACVG